MPNGMMCWKLALIFKWFIQQFCQTRLTILLPPLSAIIWDIINYEFQWLPRKGQCQSVVNAMNYAMTLVATCIVKYSSH